MLEMLRVQVTPVPTFRGRSDPQTGLASRLACQRPPQLL
jgi:hypothetical protein